MRYFIRYLALLIATMIPITLSLSTAKAEENTWLIPLSIRGGGSAADVFQEMRVREYPWWLELAAKELSVDGVSIITIHKNPIAHFRAKVSTNKIHPRVKTSFQVADRDRSGVEIKWYFHRQMELKARQTVDQSWLELGIYRW